MDYGYHINATITRYNGFFKLMAYRLRHRLFRGGWSAELERECLERGHAVAVLPYDPLRDEVVLIEQFRVGALALADGPWLLEIIAGMIEAGEEKPAVARREALEEAGCKLTDLEYICHYLVSPGSTSESVTVYCGCVDAAGVGGIHGTIEEGEDIRVHVIKRDAALELMKAGKIAVSPAIVALQWLAIHHQELCARWNNRSARG